MTKYGAPGWQSTGALSAVMWAEMGFLGDTSLIDDPEHGFWKFVGFDGWEPEGVLKDIGQKWFFDKINLKPYPCCRMLHGALDCLISIRDENQLAPKDITSIVAYCHPTVEEPVFTNRQLESTVDATFNFAYLASLVAHRVPVGVEWQDADNMRNPAIRAFMDRVALRPNTGMGGGEEMIGEKAHHSFVEVHARGSLFRADRARPRGSQGTDYELSESELEEKFRHNAQRVLTHDQCERALELLLGLEKVSHSTDVMRQISIGR